METRNCQNCKTDFHIEPEDFSFYEKIKVPPPTFCPECRHERRMLFRNFKTLYKRKSDKSGQDIISMYSEKVNFPVWSHEEWWSDDWDPKSFARDFDFSRSFFEQLQELWNSVPHYSLQNVFCTNCSYSNMAWGSKNCYLIFGCVDDENCNYGHIVWNSRDCNDNLYISKCELCYECIDCLNCNKLIFGEECENCSDSIGLYNCRDCTNCIGCINLNHKSFHIFNKKVSKEEYNQFLRDYPLDDPNSISFILSEMNKLKKSLPHKYYSGVNNVNSSGNHINNTKNVKHSFDIRKGEDSKFIYTSREPKNCYDVTFNPDIENSYSTLACNRSSDARWSHLSSACTFVDYSEHCYNSNNLFGCQGLKSAEYCILNKQYSKQEYQELKEKIIEHMKKSGEWGEWFPLSMSPFAYNESIVNEYLPKDKAEAISHGYSWVDDLPITIGQENITYEEIEKDPNKYNISMTKHILRCKKCTRNYRFMENEIMFYKKLGLALPEYCFNCRHQRRMNRRLPRTLWRRQCMCDKEGHNNHEGKCEVEFETSYAPDRPEIIYCEKCYQQEVY